MKNPPHAEGFVLRQCIEPLGLSITDAAAAHGVTRTTLSELVNEKRGILPEMAVRLFKVFRRQCGKPAYSASAARPCARRSRPTEAETAGTDLALRGHPVPLKSE
jgi:addiction module HigA family antidote